MIRLLAFVVLCLPFVPEVISQEREPVELTQSDLFSQTNWRGRTVAIDGFQPGMTRAQAVELAKTKNLKLVPSLPVLTMAQLKQGCVKASRCSLAKVQGNSIGIDLFFDAERVKSIEVGLSADMDPDVKRDNISWKFKGLTYQFFTSYSDPLRSQIFGSAEAERDPTMPRDTNQIKYVQYQYPDSGVVVNATMIDGEPVDLEVEFVAPR